MDIPFVATLTKNKVILRMFHFRKMIRIVLLLLLCAQMGCDIKREALGADNEIRVICSDIDKETIRTYLSTIFTDTLFNPELIIRLRFDKICLTFFSRFIKFQD